MLLPLSSIIIVVIVHWYITCCYHIVGDQVESELSCIFHEDIPWSQCYPIIFFDCCSTMGLWLDDCMWWFPEMVVPLDHPLIDGISWKNKPSSYGATPMYGTPYIVVENSFPTFAQPWLYLGFYPWLYLNCTPPSRKLSINCVHMFHSFVDLLQRNRGTWKSHAPRMPSPGRPGQFHHWNWGVNWL